MTMTTEQAREVHDEVMKTAKKLIHFLDATRTPPVIGEMALVYVAGVSAGHAMRPLTDLITPTLESGWKAGVEMDV